MLQTGLTSKRLQALMDRANKGSRNKRQTVVSFNAEKRSAMPGDLQLVDQATAGWHYTLRRALDVGGISALAPTIEAVGWDNK